MMWVAAIVQVAIGFTLVAYGQHRCLLLDVATGRRDRMALVDDYGSNRGYYWPWSPMMQVGFLACLLSPVTLIVLSSY